MADHAADHDHEYHHGSMSVSEQTTTYHAFLGLTKWGSLVLAAVLLFLTMWFCTDIGFLGGAVSGIVVAVIGVIILRDKPADDH